MRDLPFTRLGYGGANVGNLFRALTDDEAWLLLDTAWRRGVRHFDTAPHYGLGLSERRLGAFLATKRRDEYVLSTKVGRLLVADSNPARRVDDEGFAVPASYTRVWDFSADGVRRSLEASLQRLGLDSVDVVYLHDPERWDLGRALDTGLSALVALRDDKLVSAIGVGSMAEEALYRAASSGAVDLLMVAGRLTLLDQSAAVDVVPACRQHDVAIIAAAVFNSGLLASSRPSEGARFDYRPAPEEMLAKAKRIAEVCAEFAVPVPRAALQYPLREPTVVSVMTGGDRPEHIDQNADNLAGVIPDALWVRLRDEGLIAS